MGYKQKFRFEKIKIFFLYLGILLSFFLQGCKGDDGRTFAPEYWLGILNSVQMDPKAVAERGYSSNGAITFIRFNSDLVPYNRGQASEVLKTYLQIPTEYTHKLARSNESNGQILDRFQQYYKSIKVENKIYTVVSKDNRIEFMGGDFSGIEQNLNVTPNLSKEDALSKALIHFGAKKYLWESSEREERLRSIKGDPKATYFPKGELIVYNRAESNLKNEYRLTYKFGISSLEPPSSKYVYVDAGSGEILTSRDAVRFESQPGDGGGGGTTPFPLPTDLGICFPDKTPCIKNGTAKTRFSGYKTITTWTAGQENHYELKDYSRGKGIITYSWEFVDLGILGVQLQKIPMIDSDNYWSAAEYHDDYNHDAVLDAHWGAEKTYDYFNTIHNYSGYDRNGAKIISNVHTISGFGFNNAHWDPITEEIYYYYCPPESFCATIYTNPRDIDPQYDDFTSLDFVSHEFGHGFSAYTSELGYIHEPGALNEGFSDIWNIAVNHFVNKTNGLNKNIWLFGDETRPSGGERSASNPKSSTVRTPGPNTYKGALWDFSTTEDPHINGNVLSHWFYILSNGKQGINDLWCEYNTSGISIEKAEKIAYSTSMYLWPTAEYFDVRSASILASKYLYGSFSQEVKSTIDAWDAVGVPANTSSRGGIGMKPDHYITLVKLSEMERNSGNDCGYKDNTYLNQTIYKGLTYTIRLSSRGDSVINMPSRTHKWRVWIDFNRDGVFNNYVDSPELVAEGTISSYSGGTIQKTFTIPIDALTGNTRMRVSMKAATGGETYPRPDETFIQGEVEDYTVTIRQFTL
ncbi:M4 family metallopeptidase [Leptospira noguchii]|uniref:M4 family metalopeptidase thermolysin n=1 Tax=Leptospira noguchii TaxID=28182 RepID=UPI001F0672C4|nr:M4 family metallopeptidase [Leptospira noguchii]MCH1912483.1 M4 family metallopeptidase [Leptospira noguchii]MCH1916184.1 M4 family metallopeptidase [Leptospira noguchii]UOG63561.1 M4 family metallopeptidase [Leptospira noguchii]